MKGERERRTTFLMLQPAASLDTPEFNGEYRDFGVSYQCGSSLLLTHTASFSTKTYTNKISPIIANYTVSQSKTTPALYFFSLRACNAECVFNINAPSRLYFPCALAA
jgi:hypothetical protein